MEREAPVTADVILACMASNIEMAKKSIKLAVKKIPVRGSANAASPFPRQS